MPRPGPRPYECIRRAWHSEGHQPLRGTITQEILRVVTELHKPETRRKKEWQEKLPVVVLRAEEILYSKARSEENYVDLDTLRERLEDAVDTMIRRTDNSKDAPFMQPCVEAALFLGCSKKNPKGLRLGGARLPAEVSTRFVLPACASASAYVDSSPPRNLGGFPYGIAKDLYTDYNIVHSSKDLDSLLQVRLDTVPKRSHPVPCSRSLPRKTVTASMQMKPLDNFVRISPAVKFDETFSSHSCEIAPPKKHQINNYVLPSPVKEAFYSSASRLLDTSLIAACSSSIASLRLDLNNHSIGTAYEEVDELQLRLAPPGNFMSLSVRDEGPITTESCITSPNQQASAVCCATLTDLVRSNASQFAAESNLLECSGLSKPPSSDNFRVSPKSAVPAIINLNSSSTKKPRMTSPF